MTDRVKTWQDYYDKCAELPDLMFQSARFDIAPFQYDAIIEDVLKKLPVNPGDTVLDVGCCNGMIDMHLAPRCSKLIGVDLSEQSLVLARHNNAEHEHAEFICADAADLPLEDNSVDKILMYGVSMHGDFDWIERVISEFIRVSRNNAIIMLGDNISPGLWQKYKRNKGAIASFKAYCDLNPEKLSLMPFRVLAFHGRKNIEMAIRKFKMPEIRNNDEPVDDPQENSAFDENEMLELVGRLGQSGRIMYQNFRLPYSRFRYDLLIDVKK